LVFVADPRLSDEEVVTLTTEFKQLISSRGAEVAREESWGKRKLAYPIDKLTEGRYVVLYVNVDGKNPLPEVEMRLKQSDKVLRFLTVRTDGDRRPPAPPPTPEGAVATATPTATPSARPRVEEEV
jgi:small subunit ribosomal protein S6